MAQRENLTLRVDERTRERVEEFKDRQGYEHLSDAGKQLVEVGLREQRNPLVWRAKSHVVDWANHLLVSAVVVAAVGLTTRLFAPAQGLLAAVVLLTSAAMLLAGLEVARGIAGANEIGVQVRSVFGRRGQS